MTRALSCAVAVCFGASLCIAGACGGAAGTAEPAASRTPAAPDHLKGLHASDLTKAFREKSLGCTAPAQEKDTQHWVCESSTPLVQYMAEFYGKVPGRIAYIRVVVTQPAQPKAEVILPLLRYVSGLKYEGSDPAAARAWVEKNLETGGQTEIGPAKLKISGSLSRLVFEIKAPGSEW